ncbi:MAG TPA: protein tyrosine phosphatase family protein [Chthoniobacterales bacterium]
MKDRMQLNERITVGAQPTAEDIRRLKREGFASVVNLRTEGEEDQPLSPEAEGRAVESAGLAYLHLPVSAETMTPERVDQYRAQLPKLPGPVFVHCYKGKRAGAFEVPFLPLNCPKNQR